jgi:predicted phage terminase large subunit-like protein
MAPAEWARRAVMAYRRHAADRIVAEANQGGDLVSTVIRTFDPNVPISTVHASRGKRTRAEPVAALYEQGRVFHVEQMAVLEDQMCSYTGNPGEASPDRMDALVWALSDLFDLRVDGWGSGEGWGGKIGAMTA